MISTISYNTPEFLRVKLEDLRKAKIISEWYFIEHQPEADEKKVHIHMLVVPSKQLSTDDLAENFIQPDLPNPPRKTLWWEITKDWSDWYLYSIHDPEYLASKGQSREWVYTIDQMEAHDRDFLEERVARIDRSTLTPVSIVKKYIKSGHGFADLLASGSVPLTQAYAYKLAFDTLGSDLARNGRKTHTPKDEQGKNSPSDVQSSEPDTNSCSDLKDPSEGKKTPVIIELDPSSDEDLPF